MKSLFLMENLVSFSKGELDHKQVYFANDDITSNVVTKRVDDIEVLYYVTNDSLHNSGIEIITYKPGTWDIISFNIYKVRKIPKQYRHVVYELIKFYNKCFNNVQKVEF